MSKVSAGPHLGVREGSTLENTGASIVSVIVRLSSGGCLTQSCGLLRHFFLMGSSIGGTGNLEWLAGIHIFFYGKREHFIQHCLSFGSLLPHAQWIQYTNYFNTNFRLGFATYLASIVLFVINIRMGGLFMLLTGLILCLAALTYGVLIQNDPPLRIHFPDDVLRPSFNYSFYLTVATGGLTALLACLILLLEKFSPRKTATIFHHAVIEEDTTFEVKKQ